MTALAAQTATFGAEYSAVYDALYAEKDYERECDVIEDVFARYAPSRVRTVLDLGCGTGSHAVRLADRGYDVTGVDRAPEMLARARIKSRSVRWLEGDVRNVDAGGAFDTALLMFAVIGYQHTNVDVMSSFRNVRRHLRADGLLVFDAWYGPGVIADPPGSRSRIVTTADGAMTREVSSEMDLRRHLCAVHYRLLREGRESVAEETHVVRFFFPMELELYLNANGFRLLKLASLDDPEREPGDRDWNVLAIAQAV